MKLAGRPVVAIGGVSAENVSAVAAAGARAAALISAIADARDPAAETRRLAELFRRGAQEAP